ncbi:hypothetical protein GCM10027051_03960 [Niabella terrae]
MKNLFFCLLGLLLQFTVAAQEITVSGECIEAPVTLTQAASQIDGKPYYEGTGTVAGFSNISITIFWDNIEGAWLLAYDGQPFFESVADTPKPPGTASTTFTWDVVTAAVCTNPAPLSVVGDVALWVHFGEISAIFRDQQLRVSWESLKEQNNDHFEIEGSKDGVTFTSLATVASKATDGNSDTPLNYEWVSGKATGYLFAASMLIGLAAFCGPRRRRKLLLPMALILVFVGIGVGCKKNSGEIEAQGDYYIRIAQFDKDGTTTYSKVIKVVRE